MTSMVAVIGNAEPDDTRDSVAEQVGIAIARGGWGLVCGGLGGVMEAASRGAHSVTNGTGPPIVAILPGVDKAAANPYADITIPTGFGYARNLLVVLAADAVVAIGGQSGTLSEIAHAWQAGKPVCAFTDTPGWGAQLAGETLDEKRPDQVTEIKSIKELENWLERTLTL